MPHQKTRCFRFRAIGRRGQEHYSLKASRGKNERFIVPKPQKWDLSFGRYILPQRLHFKFLNYKIQIPLHLQIKPKPNLSDQTTQMASSSSAKLRRNTCSFTSLLLSCLNFTLFILSVSSFAPTVLLRMPPTSFGMAFLLVSAISLLSSFIGFYSQLNHFCFITHISLLLASLISLILSILALFTKEKASLSLFKSGRDPKEAKLLVRLECGALMAILILQIVVLVLSCAVHSCWVKEYQELEAKTETSARKRSKRMARVQEEAMVNVNKTEEVKAKEFDEKMRGKYGQWMMKTEFEH